MNENVRKILWVALIAGCAMLGKPSPGRLTGQDYVNAEEGFGFRVPRGWSAVESANPFRRPDWVVRFVAPGEDAAVTARTGDVGSAGCIEAARSLLATQGLSVSEEEPLTIATPSGEELPAWRGSVVGADRRGRTAIFCNGGRVVVLEATASSGAFESRREELGSAVRSFAFAGAPTLVRVAPRSTPTAVPYFVHEIVFRGQTLGQIAKWYTGEYANWKKLTDLNGLTMHDAPLRVGRRIRIPPELVVRRDPLPRPKPAAPRTAAPTPTAVPDLPAVIGPK